MELGYDWNGGFFIQKNDQGKWVKTHNGFTQVFKGYMEEDEITIIEAGDQSGRTEIMVCIIRVDNSNPVFMNLVDQSSSIAKGDTRLIKEINQFISDNGFGG